jgi:DNA invertase Pin-like site-specific DNA recombinase
MNFVGYARVSTGTQDRAPQIDALRAAGCVEVFQETAPRAATGRKGPPQGLADALGRCVAGDVLVVRKLDLLGRSLSELVAVIESLKSREVGLKVLAGQGAVVDTTKPEGLLVFGIFTALAEFERNQVAIKPTPLQSAHARKLLDTVTEIPSEMTGMAEAERQFRVASRLYGLATDDLNARDHALQIDALQAAGCTVTFRDDAPSPTPGREGLAAARDRCATGDVLVVWKLDRLGRSLSELVAVVESLKSREIELKVLAGQGTVVDTTGPEGPLVFGIFAALVEFGRERTRTGSQAANKSGKPEKLNDTPTTAQNFVGYTCPPPMHPFPPFVRPFTTVKEFSERGLLIDQYHRPFIDQSCHIEFRDLDYENGQSPPM